MDFLNLFSLYSQLHQYHDMFLKCFTGRGITALFFSQHSQGDDLEITRRISIEKLLHLVVVYSIV